MSSRPPSSASDMTSSSPRSASPSLSSADAAESPVNSLASPELQKPFASLEPQSLADLSLSGLNLADSWLSVSTASSGASSSSNDSVEALNENLLPTMHLEIPCLSQQRVTSHLCANSPASPSADVTLRRRRSTEFKPRLVELRLSARNLLNKDHLSLSDPFAVLSADHFGVGVERLGVTETIFDDLNPSWVTRFVFPARNLDQSTILIEIYDRDSNGKGAALSKHDFLGRCEVRMGEVLNAPSRRVCLDLLRMEGVSRGRTERGSVSVFTEVLEDERSALGVARVPLPDTNQMRTGTLVLRVNCASLKRKVLVGKALKTRQFYEIQRRRPEKCGGVSWTTVYRSEDGRRMNGNGYIEFKSSSMDELALHNGQPDRDLRFVFFSRNIRKDHDMVCYAQTSATELASCHGDSGHRAGSAVPLVGDFQDYDGMGAMQIVGSRRDEKRNDVLVLDINVDIFMLPSNVGYVSALNRNYIRPAKIGGGVSNRVRSLVSLH